MLEIKENKAFHLLEVLKGLSFVKIKMISDEKALLMEDIKTAVQELDMVRKGSIKGIKAKDLLNELLYYSSACF